MTIRHPANRKKQWKAIIRFFAFALLIYGGYALYLFYPQVLKALQKN